MMTTVGVAMVGILRKVRKLIGMAVTILGIVQGAIVYGAGTEDYLTYVKPVLRARCYSCNGAVKQEAGLRLDTVAAMEIGGDSGPVVSRSRSAKGTGDTGETAASSDRASEDHLLLARVIAPEPADRMPPEHDGEPLSPQQISRLRDWIASGAPAPPDEKLEVDPRDHWSFRELVRPSVPSVANRSWGRNPIDAFISFAHQQQGLVPQTESPRSLLLRRLYFDLIGVPPTIEEMAACEQDRSVDWYEATVE